MNISATFDKVKRLFILNKSKSEFLSHGLRYRLVLINLFQGQLFKFSNKNQNYALKNLDLSIGLYFNVFTASQDNLYDEILLRKNQIIIIKKGKFVIRQLLKDVSGIGFYSELKQREKLYKRGCKISPKLFFTDRVNRYLIEEFIHSKPLLTNCNEDNVNLEIIISAYNDFSKFGEKHEVFLKDVYVLYHKKLLRLKGKLNKKLAIDFVDLYLDKLEKMGYKNCKYKIEIIDIIHGDFNLSKNILQDDGGVIRIIDWEHSSSGPRYFDLFYAVFHLKVSNSKKLELIKSILDMLNKQKSNQLPALIHLHMSFMLLIIMKLNVSYYKEDFNKNSLENRISILDGFQKLLTTF